MFMIWVFENLLIFAIGRCAAFYVMGPAAFYNLPQIMETFAISSAITTIFLTKWGSTAFYNFILICIFLVKGHRQNKAAKERNEGRYSFNNNERRILAFHASLGYVESRQDRILRWRKTYPNFYRDEVDCYYEHQNYGGEP